jgi:hypothetical protein
LKAALSQKLLDDGLGFWREIHLHRLLP